MPWNLAEPCGKAGVCKAPIAGSNPAVASRQFLADRLKGLSAISVCQRGGGGTVDATDLKSVGVNSPCGFESHPPYEQQAHYLAQVAESVRHLRLLGSPSTEEPSLFPQKVLRTSKERLPENCYALSRQVLRMWRSWSFW